MLDRHAALKESLFELHRPVIAGPRHVTIMAPSGEQFALKVSGDETGRDLLVIVHRAGFLNLQPSSTRLVWDLKDIAEEYESLDALKVPADALIQILPRLSFEDEKLLGGMPGVIQPPKAPAYKIPENP